MNIKKTLLCFLTGLLMSLLLGCPSPSTPESDTTAPGEVSQFTLTPGVETIDLSWVGPNDSDLYSMIISGSPEHGLLQDVIVLDKTITSLEITGLQSGREYDIKIQTEDASGNRSSGLTLSATPLEPADTTAPAEVSGLTLAIGDAAVSLSWTNPTDQDYAGLELSMDPPAGSLAEAVILDKSITSYNVTGLSNGTAYIFTLKTKDNDGNISQGLQSAEATPLANLSVNLSPSTTDPTNQNVDISASLMGGGTITTVKWTTGVQNAQWFEGNGTALTAQRNVSFQATDNGDYSLFARDDRGNSIIETISITNIDRVAPANITIPLFSEGDQQIDLTWINPADADFAGVEISANPAEGSLSTPVVLNSSATSYSATGLNNMTDYSFSITSLDQAGNRGTSISVSGCTPYGILGLSVGASTTAPTNQSVTIEGAITGGSNISSIKWAVGHQNAAYFTSNGSALSISSTPSFEVSSNGDYSLYTADDKGQSVVEHITISNIDKTAPAAPTGLSAIYNPSMKRFYLGWTDPSDSDLDNVTILYQKSGGSEQSLVVPVGEQGCNLLNISADNGEYSIVARAVDAAGNTADSTSISATAWLGEISNISLDITRLDNATPNRTITATITGVNLDKPHMSAALRMTTGPDQAWKSFTLNSSTATTASVTFEAPTVNRNYPVYVRINGSTVSGVSTSFEVVDPAAITDISLSRRPWLEGAFAYTSDVSLTGTNLDLRGETLVKVMDGAAEISSHSTSEVDATHLSAVIDIPAAAGTYTVQAYIAGSPSGSAETIQVLTTEEVRTSLTPINGGTVSSRPSNERDGGPFYNAGTTPVVLDDYQIGTCEVTYALWYEVRVWAEANGYYFRNLGREGHDGTIGAAPSFGNYEPVTNIHWSDIVVWCNAYSEKEGLTPVYYTDSSLGTKVSDSRNDYFTSHGYDSNANGYRLPSNAEWEYAARGADPQGSSWNYSYAGSSTATLLENYAWYSSNSGSSTHNVRSPGKAPNGAFLSDMSGNVAEMTNDPAINSSRPCYMGGCYTNTAPGTNNLVTGWYETITATGKTSFIGFRLARNAE